MSATEGRITALEVDIETAASAWGVRLALAAAGWHSKTEIREGFGAPGPWFSAWVERWDWHGYPTDRVCFHAHGAIDSTDPQDATARMLSLLRLAARRALGAWDEFTGAVPWQGADGRASVNPVATRWSFEKGPPSGDRGRPTEDLPSDTSMLCDASEPGDAPLSRALQFLARGMGLEDEMTTFGFNPNDTRRFRRWGYGAKMTETSWHGARTRIHWTRHRVDQILESYVASTLDGILAAQDRLLAAYGPGGALPPGRITMAEACVRDEMDSRRKDLLGLERDDPSSVEFVARKWAARRATDVRVAAEFPEVDEAEVLRFAAVLDTSLADAGRLRTWDCPDAALALAVPAASPKP
jgi:hypothetical protein